MKHSMFASVGLTVLSAMAVSMGVMAVDYGPQITRIWGGGKGGIGRGIGRIDIDETIAGQETFIPSYLVSTVDPDGTGGDSDVKAEVSIKTAIRKKGGGWIANLEPMTVRSLPYPDPCVTDNQAGNVNQVFYENNYLEVQAYSWKSCIDNREQVAEFFADQGMFNAAVGTSNGERTLMFGLSVVGEYDSPNTDTEGEVSVYKFFSYDADSHNLLCTRSFRGTDSDGRGLEEAFSGVGPYLWASTDVLRVADVKEGDVPGQLIWRYRYYDIRTCAWILTKMSTSPSL